MTTMTANRPTAGEVVLTIKPVPVGKDHTGADAMVRLRRALKTLLRRDGRRAVSIRPVAQQREQT